MTTSASCQLGCFEVAKKHYPSITDADHAIALSYRIPRLVQAHLQRLNNPGISLPLKGIIFKQIFVDKVHYSDFVVSLILKNVTVCQSFQKLFAQNDFKNYCHEHRQTIFKNFTPNFDHLPWKYTNSFLGQFVETKIHTLLALVYDAQVRDASVRDFISVYVTKMELPKDIKTPPLHWLCDVAEKIYDLNLRECFASLRPSVAKAFLLIDPDK
ncbi:MAG: hypothetical protein FJZ63_05815 [Chlamydiae bacterium]|nr:hypothetical protein [Chlamydiota bacterium]